MAGLYLHIPFCKQACHYCDFHFSTDTRTVQELLSAMQREMELRRDFLPSPPETVYLGGGTPSLIPGKALHELLKTVRNCFPVFPGQEVTLEANPDDLSEEKLATFREAGINRLSIGIQSFRDDILNYMNRAHGASMARACLQKSRAAGFANLSIDLIYAIPGLDMGGWKETLTEAVSNKPEHISLYALTIEERTVFGNRQKKGTLYAVDDDEAARQFELMQEVLGAAGYEQYEISNFAQPGFHSRHNSSYWFQKPYLGIGPSAHSYDGNRRMINVRNNAAYITSLAAERLPAETEWLTSENKINEFILTRLRTKWGCDLRTLRESLNDNLMTRCGDVVGKYVEQGLLRVHDDTLFLTQKGKLLADRITEELIVG